MTTDKTIPRDRASYDFWTTVTLRYSDQDPMQHINNVAVTAFLESGRAGLIGKIIGIPEQSGFAMVLARLTVDYLHEITFPEPVEVGGRLARAGGRSLTSQYVIFQGERCCVVSESVNVFFDTQTRRSTEPPEHIAARIAAHLSERV